MDDNGSNAKLKSLCNVAKSAWMLKYRMEKFSPHHINSILVEAWDDFNISSGNIIMDSFKKYIYIPPPHTYQLNNQHPGICYLHPSIFWRQGWSNKQYIAPYSCVYWVTDYQDWWYYGCTPRKGYSTIIEEDYYISCRVWRCEKNNSHTYSRHEEKLHGDTKSKEGKIGKWWNLHEEPWL